MTEKGLFIRWACWLAIFACVITAHVILKNSPSFFTLEVASHIKKVENYVDMVFIVLYGIVAMFPLSVFTTWLKFEGLANARHNLGKIKETLPPRPNIKSLNASRKLRQAEKDFATLKNLHNNGLITSEMFLKRKAELIAVLGSNQIFGDGNEPSSSRQNHP